MFPLYRTKGTVYPFALAASALIALTAIMGFEMLPDSDGSRDATMRLTPEEHVVVLGSTFTTHILVDATSPVNVFAGELTFDEHIVNIESIDYNTSIADLWAEKPWYQNGEGTMNFGGGTTEAGGFTGTGELISIRFKAIGVGDAQLSLKEARVLRHDGMGTDIPQRSSIDALLSVIDAPKAESSARVAVTEDPPSYDLNSDGKVTFADASILMLNLLSRNPKYDLNRDGDVNRSDLDIIVAEVSR